MLSAARRTFAVLATLLLLGTAGVACVLIWQHYLTAPWTRDGTVEAYVLNMAPDVSGRVIAVRVTDNAPVKAGEVLYVIDPIDYAIAITTAEANLASKKADMDAKEFQSARRAQLTTLTTSVEERQNYAAAADMARAAYAAAAAQLNQARIDMGRTQVTSPVNGFVTNLQLRVGDYATKGERNVAVVDTDSFWVSANFEETKLAHIKIGDPAAAALLGFPDPIRGHVESFARGINTPNSTAGSLGLASVNPVFTWVRLAQRIPVRIHIDQIPPDMKLAIGLTATVTVGPDAEQGSLHGWLSRWLTVGG